MGSGRQPVPELIDCQRGVAHQWRRRLRRRRAHRPAAGFLFMDQERGAKRVKATWSIRRRLIPLVALCGAHVGVPFESVEYLGRGAAIHDPVERGAPVRQPDVEPSNKLQLVPSSDLLLGALRLRGTKDCNDLSRLCRRRIGDPLQVHRVLCGYEAPNPNQQRDYRNRWALHGLLDLETSTTCWTL